MTTVTVIVPAYNEGRELAANLVRLMDSTSAAAKYLFDYIIVDDGSTDETPAMIAESAASHPNVKVVTHPRNLGLGAALRSGFAHAAAEYIIVLDADLSYDPDVGIALLELLERQGADIAIASPYAPGGTVRNVPLLRRVLSREANRLLSFAANGRYATFTCMVRAYRTAFIKETRFHEDGMVCSAEILLAAIKKRASIAEMPARLRWSEQRRASPTRLRIGNILRHTIATARLAFSFRPALWLAVPGLFPGLLPIVVAAFALARASVGTLAIATAVTIAIQYTSLAVFAGQIGSFAHGARKANKRKTEGHIYS